MRTEIQILGLSLYMSGTMFVTILSLMCPFYRSNNLLSSFCHLNIFNSNCNYDILLLPYSAHTHMIVMLFASL